MSSDVVKYARFVLNYFPSFINSVLYTRARTRYNIPIPLFVLNINSVVLELCRFIAVILLLAIFHPVLLMLYCLPYWQQMNADIQSVFIGAISMR